MQNKIGSHLSHEVVSPLTQRTIEIKLANSFIKQIQRRYGEDVALEILQSVVEEQANSAAIQFQKTKQVASLHSLYDVWKILGGDGRLDLELEELNEHNLKFHINRCCYAQRYQELQLESLGILFSCRRDEPFAKALIPGVKMTQSKTILEGNNSCSFEYTLEEA
jgi:hypothetical protein